MHDIIIQAINEKKVVKFDYHGFDRVAEPHVYGTLNGIKSILTYQIRGGSKSGGLPQWRRVNLDEIHNFVITEETFPGRRPFPSNKHASFDERFAIVDE